MLGDNVLNPGYSFTSPVSFIPTFEQTCSGYKYSGNNKQHPEAAVNSIFALLRYTEHENMSPCAIDGFAIVQERFALQQKPSQVKLFCI